MAEELGFVEQFLQLVALADDHTPLMPVLKYVVEQFAAQGETVDQICLLMAHAPWCRQQIWWR